MVLLGAGGSARAVGITLALRGVSQLAVVNRTLPRASELTNIISRETGIKTNILAWEDSTMKSVIGNADIIINTTPLGMKPYSNQLPPINMEWLEPGQLVVDLIYNPLTTVFLKEAAEKGCEVLNGLGMLIQQGVLSFEIWTGKKPPVEGLRELLEKALT